MVKKKFQQLRFAIYSALLKRFEKAGTVLLRMGLFLRHGLFFLVRKIRLDASNASLDPGDRAAGIHIAGYFRQILGTGEAARLFAGIAKDSGIPFSLVNLPAAFHPRLSRKESRCWDFHLSREICFDTALIFANANMMHEVFTLFPELKSYKRRAAAWWWEFEDGMDHFVDGFDNIDEVVVFSRFVENAVRKILPKGKRSVSRLPFPFVPEDKPQIDRAKVLKKYGVDGDKFVLYFNFDFASSIWRKNPEGILAAFEKAFGGSTAARLIFKTTNDHWFPDKAKYFQSILSRHSLNKCITWISRPVSRRERGNLMEAIDCYVSLHRGEGLGLGLLESMCMGKAAIATGYGGNVDFMKPGNSMLVGYSLKPCTDDNPVYSHVTRCADPDVDQAADFMRLLYEDSKKRAMVGNQARKDIRDRFNPSVCAEAYRNWIAGVRGGKTPTAL